MGKPRTVTRITVPPRATAEVEHGLAGLHVARRIATAVVPFDHVCRDNFKPIKLFVVCGHDLFVIQFVHVSVKPRFAILFRPKAAVGIRRESDRSAWQDHWRTLAKGCVASAIIASKTSRLRAPTNLRRRLPSASTITVVGNSPPLKRPPTALCSSSRIV